MPPEHEQPSRPGREPVPAEETDTSPRASDAERNDAIDRLRTAYVEGRLDRDEFEERSRAALTARSQGQLERLFTDLPSGPASSPLASPLPVRPIPPGQRPPSRLALAVMSGVNRKGRWQVAPRSTAVAVMGGISLDLRGAVLSAPTTTITVVAVMGGVEIIVPPGIRVETPGFGFMGGWDNRTEQETDLPAGAPLLRVRGFAFMGGLDVRTKPPKPRDDQPGEPPHSNRRLNG
jgi:Domain of unknown function (DUF1707)/Cell wall-active antibiotics response 4TMS YvqF